ncbi:MAG: hypothetical protein IJ515_01455 [Clostridia bacterium]|nr:hypothetical protein [Clostridia bacterium]
MTENIEARKYTRRSTVAVVINLVLSLLSLAPLLYYWACVVEGVLLRFFKEAPQPSDGMALAVLIVVSLIAGMVFLAFALFGVIFFIIGRKSENPKLKTSTLATFIYYIVAVVLSIVAFFIVFYASGSVGS